MIYKIADFNVDITNVYSYIICKTDDFNCDDVNADCVIELDQQDVEEEKTFTKLNVSLGHIKRTAVLRKFAEWLPLHNAFVLHSACFDVGGVGIAFAAHSGTGKTTHMNLWQQLLGDKMTIVNGDKPIIRFFDDAPEIPYAYGTPWNGKEKLGCNMRTHLKHICFIERSETNYVEKVDKDAISDRLIKQVYMPKDTFAIMSTMMLVDRLLSCCDFWVIHCNMEPEAAEVAYNTIINGKTSVGTGVLDCPK